MFNDTEIERMRVELENPELMKQRIEKERQANAFIENTKRMFAEQRRDFEKEFKEWKESK